MHRALSTRCSFKKTNGLRLDIFDRDRILEQLPSVQRPTADAYIH